MPESGTTVDAHGSTCRSGQLSAGIQSGEAAQPAGL